jgi:hypothetical protein
MGTWAGQVQQFTSMLFLGTFATLAAGAVVAGALATVGSVAAVGSLALLDPILFGVVADPKQPFRPGTIAAWYYIGHWVYA